MWKSITQKTSDFNKNLSRTSIFGVKYKNRQNNLAAIFRRENKTVDVCVKHGRVCAMMGRMIIHE